MNKEELLQASDEQILDEVQKLQYLFGHSKIIRHGLNRDHEQYVTQSVAEHIYNMFTLAQYFKPLEDPENKWDWDKIHKMILWHDAGELETGDTPKHKKTLEHENLEVMSHAQVVERVPDSVQILYQNITQEYEQRETQESLFVKALDSLEAGIFLQQSMEKIC